MKPRARVSLMIVLLLSSLPQPVLAAEDRDSMELLIRVYDSSTRTTITFAGIDVPLAMILVGTLLMLMPTLARDVFVRTRE